MLEKCSVYMEARTELHEFTLLLSFLPYGNSFNQLSPVSHNVHNCVNDYVFVPINCTRIYVITLYNEKYRKVINLGKKNTKTSCIICFNRD